MQGNLTPGSGFPDDCLAVLCNLLLSYRFWKHTLSLSAASLRTSKKFAEVWF